jgi:hypothetical protein
MELDKLGQTLRQDCRLCRDEREDSVHIVGHFPALACKRYRNLGRGFLKPNDLENLRANGLISLVDNTSFFMFAIPKCYNTYRLYIDVQSITQIVVLWTEHLHIF